MTCEGTDSKLYSFQVAMTGFGGPAEPDSDTKAYAVPTRSKIQTPATECCGMAPWCQEREVELLSGLRMDIQWFNTYFMRTSHRAGPVLGIIAVPLIQKDPKVLKGATPAHGGLIQWWSAPGGRGLPWVSTAQGGRGLP